MNALIKIGLLALLGLLVLPADAQAQLPSAARSYLGQWTTFDDTDGEPKAIVELYEQGGKVHGRIVRYLAGSVCGACEGQYANRSLVGAVIVRDMEWQGDEFAGGAIFDPADDMKRYRAYMRLEGANRLMVRGFLGVRALGRTQYWTRVR